MRKLIQKICVVLIIALVLLGVLLHVYTNSTTKKIETMYEELEYENLVSYEACAVSVNSLLDLYSACNVTEKEQLIQRNTIDEEVLEQWWHTHNLDGQTKVVNLIEVRYAVPIKETVMNIKSTYKYLALIQVERAGISEIHYVYYTYSDNKITAITEVV